MEPISSVSRVSSAPLMRIFKLINNFLLTWPPVGVLSQDTDYLIFIRSKDSTRRNGWIINSNEPS